MPRSAWKMPFVDPSLIRVIKKVVLSNKRSVIYTRSRSSTIIPEFVGWTICVYNGRKYIPVSITDEMVSHKLGEFSLTRTYHGHSVGKKYQDKKRK